MAEAYKVLGQAIPAASTLTALYTAPASMSAVCSSLVVASQSTSPTTYRISVAVAGAADTSKQYLAYDAPISPNGTHVFTVGMTLATTDVVRCYSMNGQVSFTLFGTEVT